MAVEANGLTSHNLGFHFTSSPTHPLLELQRARHSTQRHLHQHQSFECSLTMQSSCSLCNFAFHAQPAAGRGAAQLPLLQPAALHPMQPTSCTSLLLAHLCSRIQPSAVPCTEQHTQHSKGTTDQPAAVSCVCSFMQRHRVELTWQLHTTCMLLLQHNARSCNH
jgi:hypothetical protein